jgi:hypothetical protein
LTTPPTPAVQAQAGLAAATAAAPSDGAPQSRGDLIDQAIAEVDRLRQQHADAVDHVGWIREHAAGMIKNAEAAAVNAAMAVEAALSRVPDGSQS